MKKHFLIVLFALLSGSIFAQADNSKDMGALFEELFKGMDTTGLSFPQGMAFSFQHNAEMDSMVQQLIVSSPFQQFFEKGINQPDSLFQIMPFADMKMLDMSSLLKEMEKGFQQGNPSIDNLFGEDFMKQMPNIEEKTSKQSDKKRKTYSL